MDKTPPQMVPVLTAVILIVIVTSGIATIGPGHGLAAGAEVTVTRALSTTRPISGSTLHVSLNISGLKAGGIMENIPEGFTFVSTTHPPNQTHVAGQKVLFVVLNETSIVYTLRASRDESVSGTRSTFTGVWYDALEMSHGDIEGTRELVKVAIAESPSPSPSPPPSPSPLSPSPTTPALIATPTPTPTPAPTPGFSAICGLVSLALVYLHLRLAVKAEAGERMKRRGGRRDE